MMTMAVLTFVMLREQPAPQHPSIPANVAEADVRVRETMRLSGAACQLHYILRYRDLEEGEGEGDGHPLDRRAGEVGLVFSRQLPSIRLKKSFTPAGFSLLACTLGSPWAHDSC